MKLIVISKLDGTVVAVVYGEITDVLFVLDSPAYRGSVADYYIFTSKLNFSTILEAKTMWGMWNARYTNKLQMLWDNFS